MVNIHTKCICRVDIFTFGHGSCARGTVRESMTTGKSQLHRDIDGRLCRSGGFLVLPLSQVREERNPTILFLWRPPRIQLVLQIRPPQSASPSLLPLNLLITSSTSLFHQDKPNRSRVCHGEVAGMGRTKAFGTKSVSFPITISQRKPGVIS